MELEFINYTYKDKILNFNINKSTITGVTGTSKDELLKIIALKKQNKGQVIIDNIKINKDDILDYQKKISYIDKTLITNKNTILELMVDYIKRHNLMIKDPMKKIKDSLKIVDMSENILARRIYTLSESEKKIVQLAIALLSNPKVIIANEPFKCLDKYNEKKFIMLIQRLKEQYDKTIIIGTDDSNKLYKYTTNMIFFKNDEIFLTGKTNDVYLRVDYLKRNKFEIPDIVEFTYIARKKKEVKIDYHKDVRDIIKDIYKHI